MAGIKQSILDVMNQLSQIAVDGVPVFKHIRIWNNQLEYERDGQMYYYPKPALFIEVENDPQYEQLGGGVLTADIVFRIHIVCEQLDAQENTFEQNLQVFDYRDYVMAPYQNKGLSQFAPAGFTPLTKVTEAQDYEHDNLYHYTVDFAGNYKEGTGSPLDPSNGVYIYKQPPIDLQVDAAVVAEIDGVPNNIISKPIYKFRIPGGKND